MFWKSLLIICLLLALPTVGFAQTLVSPIAVPSLLVLVVGLITWLLVIVAFFAVLYIVWAGFKYVTAGGDSKKAGAAKDSIIHAIIGIVISMTAQLIIKFVFTEVLNVSKNIVNNVFE